MAIIVGFLAVAVAVLSFTTIYLLISLHDLKAATPKGRHTLEVAKLLMRHDMRLSALEDAIRNG